MRPTAMRVLQPLVLAWTVAVLGIAAWCALRWGSAAERERVAQAACAAMGQDIQRLQALRAASPVSAHGRRPDADLVTRAQRALADAGLPIGACSGVQPRADQVSPGTAVRVQTVQLTLRGLSPAELGGWLAAWHAVTQPWLVSELQLVHVATAAAPAAAAAATNNPSLDSNRFDISVVLAAPYLEAPP
jgi:hypothetical protein